LWEEDGVLFASQPTTVVQIGNHLGVPLTDVPIVVTFARLGPVGALSIRCLSGAAVEIRATLDDGRPAPDPVFVGQKGGPLPSEWRGVTSIAISTPVPGLTPSTLLGLCWVRETTLDQIDSRQDAIDLATASSSDWTGEWTTMSPGLYRLTCEAQAFRNGVLV